MSKSVIAAFSDKATAEKAVNALRTQGFDKDISIAAKKDNANDNYNNFYGNDPVSDGATTGGVIGGIAGLVLGAGALAIPGIGPILAAGPLAGALSGAATGGIAGGLADFGIPSDRGSFYEDKVKQGSTIVSVQSDAKRVQQAAKTLQDNGAQNVETF
ncbi:conserved hypothetical protein [Desulfofarcimen acetoxidans DSM 771]|jgi:uncharacterized membrane protein|uniref:General stress protein 17M-like domain-containing protein n=1 Tax=Desulfofarcimen acetoxidans (strain ATCC 49208 / DSM 771 / KCTC 5769 / VKM B-1644 / 5575) TaxID=485916 RepID=C8VVZ4_DESAS|nr:general stress protein [Desulfofarcimen acetoxidans]ACV64281.1 conserved hypothetical protein [Desulfofarcimen acetoxidans DSM 771]